MNLPKVNSKKKIWIEVEALLIIVTFVLISFFVFQVSLIDIFKFILFQLCGMFIPGLALSCMHKREISILSRMCLAYALGYGINIVEYFLIELTGRRLSYEILVFLVLIISLIVIHKRKKSICESKALFDKNDIMLMAFILVMFFLNVFTYAMSWKDVFSMDHDLTWWCHNSVALKLMFRPDNLFMSGTTLSYHYFSSIQVAFCSLVTGIDILALSVPFYTITKTLLMVGAVNFMLEVFNVHGITRILGYIVVLCTTGLESYSIVTYFHHTLLVPFGFDVGYAFGILFVSFLYLQWKETKFDFSLLVYTLLSWGVCVGAKAPIAAVLLMIAGLLCVYWLFNKKFSLCFGYGISILIIFFIIAIYCVGMLSVAGGDSGSYYLAVHSYEDISTFAGRRWPILFAVIARWFCMSPTVAILLIISVIDVIVLKKAEILKSDYWIFAIIAFISYMWGISLWNVILADGSSEMYYGMAAFIPAYFVILCIYKLVQTSDNRKSIWNLVKKGAILLSCCIGLYFYMFNSYAGAGGIVTLVNRVANIKEIAMINQSRINDLQWIRDNTEDDSLIVSDVAVMTGNLKYYFTGIVSERQQYLEGAHMLRFGNEMLQEEISRRTDLVNGLYNNQDVIFELKNEGVDYIVQTLDISPQFIYNEEELELVASLETINVYKIKDDIE